MAMTSSRPYMIRALYEWILENECTPYVLVDAHADGVEVPQEYVNKDGQIVLNISPSAVSDLLIENHAIVFNARFGGVPRDIYVATSGVLGIYARENGQGMIFEPEAPQPPQDPDDRPKVVASKEKVESETKRPSLKVVK